MVRIPPSPRALLRTYSSDIEHITPTLQRVALGRMFDFWIARPMQVAKVAENNGIKALRARLSCGDEVHVIVNAATADALLPGGALCFDDFVDTEINEAHARYDAFPNHGGRNVCVDPHAESAARESRKGFVERMRAQNPKS